MQTDQLISKKRVAEILDCSTRTVEREVSSGHLTRVKIRGSVRFRESEVMKIVNGGTK